MASRITQVATEASVSKRDMISQVAIEAALSAGNVVTEVLLEVAVLIPTVVITASSGDCSGILHLSWLELPTY